MLWMDTLRIWGKLGVDKIAIVGRGIFLVKFNNVEASLKVTNEGVQFFLSKTTHHQAMGS